MERDKLESGIRKGLLNRIKIKFGEVAKQLGLVNSSDVKNALVKQESDNSQKRIGEILVDDRKLTENHVGKVLKVQKEWKVGASVIEVDQASRKASTKKPAKKATKVAAKKPVTRTSPIFYVDIYLSLM